MTDLPRDELLSAYLDGELTAEEEAYVERLLAEDPEARRLLEELRALGGHLQALPRAMLADDFDQRVLRAAERATLAGPAESVEWDDAWGREGCAAAVSANSAPTLRSAVEQEPHRGGWAPGLPERARRPLVYALVAIAAALLIMVFFPEEPAETGRPVAISPDAAPRASGERPAGGERAMYFSRAGDTNQPLQPADEPMPESLTADRQAAATERVEFFQSKQEAQRGVAAAAGATGAPADGLPAMEMDRGVGGQAGFGGGFGGAGFGVEEQLYRADLNLPGLVEAEAADNGLLIVKCDITPQAARQALFQKVLARQKIAVEGGWTQAEELVDKLDRNRSSGGPAGQQLARRNAGLEEAEREDEPSEATPRDFDVVYVEATPEQLEAALAEIAAQPDSFLTLAVDPVPGAELQNVWHDQYSRDYAAYGARARSFRAEPEAIPGPSAPSQVERYAYPADDQEAAGSKAGASLSRSKGPGADQAAGLRRNQDPPAMGSAHGRQAPGTPESRIEGSRRAPPQRRHDRHAPAPSGPAAEPLPADQGQNQAPVAAGLADQGTSDQGSPDELKLREPPAEEGDSISPPASRARSAPPAGAGGYPGGKPRGNSPERDESRPSREPKSGAEAEREDLRRDTVRAKSVLEGKTGRPQSQPPTEPAQTKTQPDGSPRPDAEAPPGEKASGSDGTAKETEGRLGKDLRQGLSPPGDGDRKQATAGKLRALFVLRVTEAEPASGPVAPTGAEPAAASESAADNEPAPRGEE